MRRGSIRTSRRTSRFGVPWFSSSTETLGVPRERICSGVKMPSPRRVITGISSGRRPAMPPVW